MASLASFSSWVWAVVGVSAGAHSPSWHLLPSLTLETSTLEVAGVRCLTCMGSLRASQLWSHILTYFEASLSVPQATFQMVLSSERGCRFLPFIQESRKVLERKPGQGGTLTCPQLPPL